jgi:hypothetical protein
VLKVLPAVPLSRHPPQAGHRMSTSAQRPIVVGNWKMHMVGQQALGHVHRLLQQGKVTSNTPDLAIHTLAGSSRTRV